MSLRLVSWRDAEARELERLRTGTMGTELLELVEVSGLLELARLTQPGVDLASYVQSALDVMTGFFPVSCCELVVEPEGLPSLRATFGDAVDEDDQRLELPLGRADAPLGHLVVVTAVAPAQARRFFEQAAAQITAATEVLLTAERLRREVAAATALRLAASITSLEHDGLQELAQTLASLPNAIGARLAIRPQGLAEALEISAGIPQRVEELVTERHVSVADDTDITIRLFWAGTPGDAEVGVVDDVLVALQAALARADRDRRLEEEVETDPLTGVGNRRRAGRALAAAVSRAERYGEQVAVLSFDLDRFKRVNDTLGHDAGDGVLAAFAALLLANARGYDTVARMGGEEFLIVCPATDAVGGLRVADRIRSFVSEACADSLPDGWNQTVSVGVAVYPDSGELLDAVLRAADAALYRAKREGRDRVVVA